MKTNGASNKIVSIAMNNMGKILEKWLNDNNIKTHSGYEMANCFTMSEKKREIKYSDILLGKRIKCAPFALGYREEMNNKYSIEGNEGYGSRIELSEVDFLEYAKGKLSEYNKWYAIASYPKQETGESETTKITQIKLF